MPAIPGGRFVARHLPGPLRRDRPLEPLIADLTRGIRRFLRSANLSESVLFLDGPGGGLSTPMLALALLGMERVNRFREVYCLSASTCQYLCFVAQEQGGLRLTPDSARLFNKKIQRLHRAGPVALAKLAASRFQRPASCPFDRDLPQRVVELVCTDEFCERKVSTLPANLRILTHCNTDRTLETIRAGHPTLGRMTIREAVHAGGAVPTLYNPATFDGRAYSDGFWSPDIRRERRRLFGSPGKVLAIHMRNDGIRDNVHFLKVHHDPSANLRVGLDFLYLVLGLPNGEFGEAVRAALFELEPI